MKKSRLLSSACLLIFFSPSFFVSSFAAEDENKKKAHDHGHPIEEIMVTGSPHAKARFDIMQGSSLLKGDELDRMLETTIGETLSHIPGVSSSFFGAGASRPIIRGLGGARIRMLLNGISTADAGNTSPDHAVAVEMLTVQKIEILRGASTLIYGNNAIGGVVNVIDDRIPTKIPEEDLTFKSRFGFGTGANDVSGGAAATFSLSNSLAFHLNGSYRNAGDFNIPSSAESAVLKASEGEGHEEEEEDTGKAKNSSVENYSAATGLSYISDAFSFGGSLSFNNSHYGVPIHGHGDEHEEHEGEEDGHEDENVRIKLEQKRLDLKAELNADFLIYETVKFRFGLADYNHKEIEEGSVATHFKNKEWEARVELVQKETNNWHGSAGFQVKDRDFSAVGDEAFIPPTNNFQMGMFFVEELSLDFATLEFGARYDYQKSKIISDPSAKSLTYNNLSFSAGAAFHPLQDSLIGLSLSHTERAPTTEELYSNGPHFATASYELGSQNLTKETARSMELTFKKESGDFSTSLNLYHTWFNDFIYSHETGEKKDDLEVFEYRQKDARFYGAEIELNYVIFQEGLDKLSLKSFADFVNAKFTSGEYIPRIPAKSAAISLHYETEYFTLATDIKITDQQSKITEHELKTEGYTKVNAEIAYRPFGADKDLTIRLQATNLLNAEMRQHTSFLKDLLPMPGRNIKLSLHYNF